MTEPVDTDADLLVAWRGGDKQAGERLFERHVAGITRFFRNKLSTGVEDLVQDTFVGLVAGRERVRETSSVRSYLFAIAHNVLRVHLRALARERALDDDVTSIADIIPQPSSILGRRAEHTLLLAALRRLPLADQIILELSFWEGLSAAEIANIVGGTPSSVRGRLFRGRKQLGDALAALAASPSLLESTLDGFDRWIEDMRLELGRGAT